MQSDIEVLRTVCTHFNEYVSEDLKKLNNKVRTLKRRQYKDQIEIQSLCNSILSLRQKSHDLENRYFSLKSAIRQLIRVR